jgi:hypothetical protein
VANLGSWTLGDTLTVSIQVRDPRSGAAINADAAPTYRVYQDTIGTPIRTGTMSLVDSANATGFYGVQIPLTTVNGFSGGHRWRIRITATVNTATGTPTLLPFEHTWQLSDVTTIAVSPTQMRWQAGTVRIVRFSFPVSPARMRLVAATKALTTLVRFPTQARLQSVTASLVTGLRLPATRLAWRAQSRIPIVVALPGRLAWQTTRPQPSGGAHRPTPPVVRWRATTTPITLTGTPSLIGGYIILQSIDRTVVAQYLPTLAQMTQPQPGALQLVNQAIGGQLYIFPLASAEPLTWTLHFADVPFFDQGNLGGHPTNGFQSLQSFVRTTLNYSRNTCNIILPDGTSAVMRYLAGLDTFTEAVGRTTKVAMWTGTLLFAKEID